MPDLIITVEYGYYTSRCIKPNIQPSDLRPDAPPRESLMRAAAHGLDFIAKKVGVYDRFAEVIADGQKVFSRDEFGGILSDMEPDMRARVQAEVARRGSGEEKP